VREHNVSGDGTGYPNILSHHILKILSVDDAELNPAHEQNVPALISHTISFKITYRHLQQIFVLLETRRL
jgi:hypothetical protein